MNPAQADAKLPRLPDGRPTVVLMTDPDGANAFVSLVDKGANMRRILARKGLEELPGTPGPVAPPPAPIDAALIPVLDLGQGRDDDGNWFVNMLRGVFGRSSVGKRAVDAPGSPVGVSKDAGDAIDFNQALAPMVVRQAMWDGFDGLRTALCSILDDPAITDKRSAWATSIGQFTGWALQLVDRIPATKRAEIAAELRRTDAIKAGRVLSAASLAKLASALEAGRAALAALEELEASGQPADASKQLEIDPMDPTKIADLAHRAGLNAVSVAKSLNPTATPAQLQAVYTEAMGIATKMAVGGPPQPGMTPDALANQLAGHLDGSPKDPLSTITAALNNMSNTVSKMAETVAKLDGALNGTPAADGKAADPGLVAVVRKQGEAFGQVSQLVFKMADLPEAPANAVAPAGAPAEGDPAREPVKKADKKPLSFMDLPVSSGLT